MNIFTPKKAKMTSIVDHVEVAPRMWDKNLAAPLHRERARPRSASAVESQIKVSNEEPLPAVLLPKSSLNVEHPQPSTSTTPTSPPSQTQEVSFYAKWKSVIVPAVLIVCILICSYILWKYFTSYRLELSAKTSPPPIAQTVKKNPMDIVRSLDTSKYEVDSDDEDTGSDENDEDEETAEEDSRESNVPTTIKEVEEDEDDSEEEEEDEEEADEEKEDTSSDDTNDENDQPPMVTYSTFMDNVPDFKKIEELILDSSVQNIPMLEDSGDSNSSDENPFKPSRKSRKNKRVIV